MKNIKSKQSAPPAKSGNQPFKPSVPISKSRQRVFSIIAITLPVVFLILLELILRLSGYGDNYSLFVNHRIKDLENYYEVNPEIGKKYFNKMGYSAPAMDIFLKKKPDDVFRIFAMGSSSVAGFPYDNNLMFPRILSERLRDAYPDKKIEMVNTAITAINSFTLADFMPQILAQNPDAILFYDGHNEFYGAFGAGSNEAIFHSPTLIRMHLALLDYKVYQLTVNIVGKIAGIFGSGNSAGVKHGTLMTRMVKDADITFGSKKYKEGIQNFEQNLDAMLSMAKQKNVQIFISDQVSNLRDLKPFKSIAINGLKGADEYYEAAKKYEAQGDIQKAKENYILARDYDCIRFRASSDINDIIKKLADKYQAHFVPTVELFDKNSPNGIVGNNLLTEHLHPNIPGQFLLAESFYKEITQAKLIAPEINTSTEKSYKGFIQDYGYSNLDYMIGKHRVTNLSYHWPFVDESKAVDYRQIYKPVGIVDSLAFTVMATQSLSLAEAHIRLGEMYMKKGDMLNAFKEYNSLTKISPYWSINFRKAGDCLLQMNNLARALTFYERSTEYGHGTFYAHFRAGEICLIKNDLESALSHFKKSQETATAEEKQKSLYKIYQTLTYLNRTEEGKDIAAYLKKTNPNQPLRFPPRVGSYLDYIPVQVKSYVDSAKEAMAKNENEKAIELLSASLESCETSVVFRMLGELYLKTKEFGKSRYYLNKAYPDFKFDPSFQNSLKMIQFAGLVPEGIKPE
jgi:tetratricopeptide (TPR) repeat protein